MHFLFFFFLSIWVIFLISTLVERFSVSRMQDFFAFFFAILFCIFLCKDGGASLKGLLTTGICCFFLSSEIFQGVQIVFHKYSYKLQREKKLILKRFTLKIQREKKCVTLKKERFVQFQFQQQTLYRTQTLMKIKPRSLSDDHF